MILREEYTRSAETSAAEAWREGLRIREELNPAEWAAKERWIAQGASPLSTSGSIRYDVSKMPHCEEPMVEAVNPEVQVMVLDWASGLGKTEVCVNIIGFKIEHAPTNQFIVYPKDESGKKFSRDVLQRMIESTPAIRKVVTAQKSRDSGNTLTYKALMLSTPIPTPTGWTTMGELAIGDRLFDDAGRECCVTGKTAIKQGECFEVCFSDGSKITADAGHLWSVSEWKVVKKPSLRQVRVRAVLTTRQLVEKGVRKQSRYRFSIRNAPSLRLNRRKLPVDPYVLGAWLGDGMSSRSWIISGGKDAEELASLLIECGCEVEINETSGGTKRLVLDKQKVERLDNGRIHWKRSGTLAGLHKLKLIGKIGEFNKTIPPEYLRASTAQRISLLQGLMDTDGSATAKGGCIFTTSCPAIEAGARELLLSLGVTHSVAKIPSYYQKEGERKYCKVAAVFNFRADFPVFRLRRKAERQGLEMSDENRFRRIVAINPVETSTVCCIEVDSPSHLFLAGRGMVPTHNCYLGGSLYVTAARSPSNFRGPRAGLVYCDEIDAFPASVGGEGDPISLAFKRAEGFADSIKLLSGTPTLKNHSNIENWLNKSDRRVRLVPCRRCDRRQLLMWRHKRSDIAVLQSTVEWPKLGKNRLEKAVILCAHCAASHNDTQRLAMIYDAEWKPTLPFNGIRGYWLNGINSTLPPEKGFKSKLHQFAVDAHNAANSVNKRETVKVWTNTFLAESFQEEQDQKQEWRTLYDRREDYPAFPSAGK